MRSHRMALTPEHLAQGHRDLEDTGPDPTWTCHTDEDYAALVYGLVASPPGGLNIWLFASEGTPRSAPWTMVMSA
jgi:cation transport protein ChaC